MSVLSNSNAISTGGAYNITDSLRFRESASPSLTKTFASSGNRKKWTWSAWVKRGALGADYKLLHAGAITAGSSEEYIAFYNDLIYYRDGITGNYTVTTPVYRDTSAWYHIIYAYDSANATQADRGIFYVNGVRQATSTNAIALNRDSYINHSTIQGIGSFASISGYSFDGYMTEVNFVDGQALTPSDFGETNDNGVWSPIEYTGTYGTNGFYLNFSDGTSTTTLGYDYSGNNNNWTTNNVSLTAGATYDLMSDVPTLSDEDTANFATWNPLDFSGLQTGTIIYTNASFSNGNLKATCTTTNSLLTVFSTIKESTIDKTYWEATFSGQTGASANYVYIGIGGDGGLALYSSDGNYYNGSSWSSYGATYTSGDTIGVATSLSGNTIEFFKNGVSQGVKTISKTSVQPRARIWNDTAQAHIEVNFGQRPFAYTPPAGYKKLNTYNLPDSTIKDGSQYFDATLYTGTGSALSVTNASGFQPDLVWIKGRSGATDHGLYDAVRGVQNQIESNTTTDETTESTGLTAFNSNGFTVGALAQLNTSTATYVAWQWRETSTSGLDVVIYTGNGSARTISHNLGVAPKMIIVKARTTASTDQGWAVYHAANTAAPETDYLLLNSTAATADLDTVWNDTAPTSSVFSVGTNALVNANNDTYVAYCFAEVEGFSKIGSYVGNGVNGNGPFVYCGFRPAFILFKNTNTTQNWIIHDVARDTYNYARYWLSPNTSGAEYTDANIQVDLVSNGFKIRTSIGTELNGNGNTIIYMAFAENPFKNSLAR